MTTDSYTNLKKKIDEDYVNFNSATPQQIYIWSFVM